VQSATISCYDCGCGGHRVQRPRLRQVVDVARSRSRILSRRNDRSEGLSSRPLEALAARMTRAFGREGEKDVAVTSSEARSRDLNCRRGALRPNSRIAVVTDNRKHRQMRLFEAFEISEELAVSRCEMGIFARISTVCRADGKALAIRRFRPLSHLSGAQAGQPVESSPVKNGVLRAGDASRTEPCAT